MSKRLPRNKDCKVKGCEMWNYTKRLCNMHYQRWRSEGMRDFEGFIQRTPVGRLQKNKTYDNKIDYNKHRWANR